MIRTHWLSIACLLAMAFQSLPVIAQGVPNTDSQLTLTEPTAMQVAESLSKAIDEVSARVRECVVSKASPAHLCFCRYPQEVNRLRSQYEAALVTFPPWKDKVLNWSSLGGKESRTVSMSGLASQFRQECPK